MSEIGIKSFTARDTQDHGAENDNAVYAVAHKKIRSVKWIYSEQNPRFTKNLYQTETGDGDEPDHHDWTE